MKWLDRLFDWFTPELFDWFTPAKFTPVKQTTDPNCPHCRGLGYDASGYACTCVKEKK